MTLHLGNVPASTTIYIPFATYDSSGASVTMTGFAVTDIEIYKDGSVTQRASDNGVSLLDTDGTDFDGITGIHGFSIDLSDNSDSGFYAAGSWYWVVVSAVTVDSQTVNFVAATFRIAAAEATAGTPSVNATQISGDSTAADNLESQFDGTGLSGDTYPSTQAQVGRIGSASGGALNFANSGDNIDGAVKSVSFVGVESSGTNASVNADDGTYHVITHSGNAIDIVYQFDVGGNRSAVSATLIGYLTSSNDTITVQAYNGSGWDTIGSITGTNGTTDSTHVFPLLATHTGTGADLGSVFIRLVCSGQTAPVLNTDALLVQAVSLAQSAGYSGGYIYYDSDAANTNTEAFVDGTADNPVSSWAAVKSLAASVGLSKVDVIGTLTLDSTAEGIAFIQGRRATLALGGQNIGDTEFDNFKSVSGTGTTTGARPVFTDCFIDTCTLPPTLFRVCGFTATVTAGSAGHWSFENCRSAVDGSGAPVFDFNSVDNNNIGFSRWARGVTVSGLAASDVMTINGVMNTITLNGADATVNISGQYGTLTNNLTGSPAVSIANSFDVGDIAAILVDTGTDIPASLATIAGYVDTEIASLISAVATVQSTVDGLNDVSVSDILTTALADVYAANGVAPTVQQALMAIHQALMAFAISGTTNSVKKLDGSTEAFTVTLDDATSPTSAIRS